MPSEQRFPKRLRVMAEYGSSGIWVDETIGPFRHGMISYKKLGLPKELSSRFTAWIERYWARSKDGFDAVAFNKEGRSLAVALKSFVGPDTEVVFEGEAPEGGLLAPEIIEDS
jgi:hypothetical protein